MNQDLDSLEEKLKNEEKRKKEQKKSGRSVFKLQEIIKEKAEKDAEIKDEKDRE